MAKFGLPNTGQPCLCNFVQFGLATMPKNILQLCPKSACKKHPEGYDGSVAGAAIDENLSPDNAKWIRLN
jgi:hypothetical protein